MQNAKSNLGQAIIRVRCTHCRFDHDPRRKAPCAVCGSQMAMYRGLPMMIVKNASDGLPLHKLDPKKRRVLIPRNS